MTPFRFAISDSGQREKKREEMGNQENESRRQYNSSLSYSHFVNAFRQRELAGGLGFSTEHFKCVIRIVDF